MIFQVTLKICKDLGTDLRSLYRLMFFNDETNSRILVVLMNHGERYSISLSVNNNLPSSHEIRECQVGAGGDGADILPVVSPLSSLFSRSHNDLLYHSAFALPVTYLFLKKPLIHKFLDLRSLWLDLWWADSPFADLREFYYLRDPEPSDEFREKRLVEIRISTFMWHRDRYTPF